MNQQYSIKIPAHKNIYSGNTGRELRIDYSIPKSGINKHTGLVIFVPGFGGNIDSNIYKKMRNIFADKHNLITIQCDYFGSSFMQDTDNFVINKDALHSAFTNEEVNLIYNDSSVLLKLLSQKAVTLHVTANLNETIDQFNDMSFMQAIDIITAVEAIKTILSENNYEFNPNRVIGYGHSHGAYILHLANILTPDLFTFIVDNSAWIEPVYLSNNRYLYKKLGKGTLAIGFDYFAKKVIINTTHLNLESLYTKANNKCQIISFQGDNDNLINHIEKKSIMKKIPHSTFRLISENDVDNIKYNSNTHGLSADFIELFDHALRFETNQTERAINRNSYNTYMDNMQIIVDYTNGLPIFSVPPSLYNK